MSQRECIGGPFDGDTVDLERRMLLVSCAPDVGAYVSTPADDEPERCMGALLGRYTRYPKDQRPEDLRWIPY